MAEFTEVFDDAFDNIGDAVKKVSKKKTFFIIAAGVGAIALIGYFMKNRSGESSYSYATGYTGYPVTTGGASEDGGYYTDNEINDIISDYNKAMTDMQTDFETTISDMETDYERAMSSMQTSYENTISDMERQSEKAASDYEDLIEELQNENEVLVETMSAKTATPYNPDYQSNINYQQLINNAIINGASGETIDELNDARDNKIAITGRSLEESNSSYDPNINYTDLINQAKSAGASQDVIDNLTAQRQAKIDGEYGGIDPDTKTSTSSSSKKTSSTGSYYKSSASSSTKNSNGSTTYTYSNGGSMTVASNGNVTWVTGRTKK